MCLPNTPRMARHTAVPSAHRHDIVLPAHASVIDLTQPLSPRTPTFPPHPPLRVIETANHAADGYATRSLELAEHTGTHIDAPLHFAADGAGAHELPIGELVAPLAVIDVDGLRAPDIRVEVEDLERWEQRNGPLLPGSVVVMRSGWAARADDSRAYLNPDASGIPRFPGWDVDALRALADRDAIAIGVDTLSLDPGVETDFPAHRCWLGSGRWGIENLTNLGRLPEKGGVLVVGALRLHNGTGAPARVLALINDDPSGR